MKRNFVIYASLIMLLCSVVLIQAQNSSRDRSARILQSGIEFYNSGDYENAYQDFQTIIASYKDSEWIDEAYIWTAKYYYKINNDIQQAMNALNQVIRDHPESSSIAEAYFLLGDFQADAATTREELLDGLASYERVERLFPESVFAARSILKAGMINTRTGDLNSAAVNFQTIIDDYSSSDVVAQAQLLLGDVYFYLREIDFALQNYQRVRLNFPEDDWASVALDRLTLVYRLFKKKSLQKGVSLFARDRSFSLKRSEAFDELYYIDISVDGEILLTDRGKDTTYIFNKNGDRIGEKAARRPWMSKQKYGNDLIILSDRLLKNGRALNFIFSTAGSGKTLNDIRSFAVGPFRDYYLFDEGHNSIFRFSPDMKPEYEYRGRFWRDVWDMEVDRFGNLFILEADDKRLVKYDREGRRQFENDRNYDGVELRDPVSLDIDVLGNVYILDRRLKRLFVLDNAGKYLDSYSFGDVVGESFSLAVSSDGSVYVADRRNRLVHHFQ